MYVFERSLCLVLDNGTERQKCKKDHKTTRTKERDGSVMARMVAGEMERRGQIWVYIRSRTLRTC